VVDSRRERKGNEPTDHCLCNGDFRWLLEGRIAKPEEEDAKREKTEEESSGSGSDQDSLWTLSIPNG
jgi:hypothetical protein